jgi:hypothetical protein
MTIICTFCNKEYASYSSRSNHIKKFHPHQNTNSTPDPPNQHQNPPQNNIICNKCNKKFSRQDSLSRHITKNRCKKIIINKDDKDLKIEKMEKEMLEYKKEMDKMKKMLQKSLKIHPKTLQKINNQLNNNGTINNITIIQLGKENLSELLTKQEKLGILNRQAMGINDLVELAHTSGKYKNCMNVYITNLQNTIGYMYDEKQNNFIAVNKNELLNDLVDSRMYDIEKFYDEFQEKIDPAKGQKIKKFIDRMNNDEDCLKGLKKEEIKLILYNNKEAISAILPKNKKLEEDENTISV